MRTLSEGLTKYIISKLKVILTEALVIITIIFISLRVYIFGNGYYDYSDQHWGLSIKTFPSGVFSTYFSPSIPILQMTRDVVTWPYILFRLTKQNILTEKLFIIYSFGLIIGFSYLYAKILLESLNRLTNSKIGLLKREIFKALTVITIFTNFEVMGLNVDGGPWSDTLVLLSLATIIVIYSTWSNSKFAALVSSALFSISLLVDPDYTFMFMVSILLSTIFYGLVHGWSNTFRRLTIFIISSLPALLFIIYGLVSTFVPNGPYSNYRVFSEAGVLAFSKNLTWLNAFEFLGYAWSFMTYSPPSLLGYHGPLNVLPAMGYPTQVILPPPKALDEIWLITLPIPAAISLTVVLSKKLRQLSVPSALIFLLGILFSQYARINLLFRLVYNFTKLPYLGKAIGTAFAVPDHFLLMVTAAYIILLPSTVYLLLNKKTKYGETNKISIFKRSTFNLFTRYLITSFILFIVIFNGWQAFNGSFYPSRAWPPFTSGNGVPNAAPFTPVTPPKDVSTVYNFLLNSPGNFRIYWPALGTTPEYMPRTVFFFDESDSPKPLAVAPALPYLIQNNLTSDIAPYLDFLNIKYIVVQNETSNILQQEFGSPSYKYIISVLNHSGGLVQYFQGTNIEVFKVYDDVGPIYRAQLLLNYNQTTQEYAVAYNLFRQLGLNVTFVPYSSHGINFTINSINASICLLSPIYLATNFTSINHIMFGTVNNSIRFVASQGNSWVGNWTITDWAQQPLDVLTKDSQIILTASNPTTASLSFNGSLVAAGGVQKTLDTLAVANLTFYYKTSALFTGQISAYIMGLNSKLEWVENVNKNLLHSSNWKRASVEAILSPAIKYFGFRIQSLNFTGSLYIQNITFNYSVLKLDQFSPFGSFLVINTARYLTLPTGWNYLEVSGNGTVNGLKINSTIGILKWIQVYSKGEVSVRGNLYIYADIYTQRPLYTLISNDTLVYNDYYYPPLRLKNDNSIYEPLQSLDDTNIFINVLTNNFYIFIENEFLLKLFYIIIVAYIYIILLYSAIKYALKSSRNSVIKTYRI